MDNQSLSKSYIQPINFLDCAYSAKFSPISKQSGSRTNICRNNDEFLSLVAQNNSECILNGDDGQENEIMQVF